MAAKSLPVFEHVNRSNDPVTKCCAVRYSSTRRKLKLNLKNLLNSLLGHLFQAKVALNLVNHWKIHVRALLHKSAGVSIKTTIVWYATFFMKGNSPPGPLKRPT